MFESFQLHKNNDILRIFGIVRKLSTTFITVDLSQSKENMVSSNMSWTAQIKNMADKARQKGSWVLTVFYNRSPTIMLTLYKSMVRSLLEYCCPLWDPHKVSDIQELEGVQRAFTARIAGSQDLDYWERLKKLSLMSLQRRRERFILLHMWKILNGSVSNDVEIEFVSRPRTGIKALVPSLRAGVTAFHQSL